ncbi:MAG: hypothetical protein C5S49_00515 [Candidatus Methanogaster sp.]|nr:MAG: hypothetical protein C5S49_00515 [ANME-2 cluster archaeon]
MGETTTEFETRSDVVSGTATYIHSGSGSQPGFPEWGCPSETRLYITYGAIPPMQFLLSYQDVFHSISLHVREHKLFLQSDRPIDQNRTMVPYNMNIKNHRNIHTPGIGGISCT